MAVKTWHTIKVQFCPHANSPVHLEAEVVYPAEFLPEQNPRVLGHRCSHAYLCQQSDQVACVWSGSNPLYDPFLEKA